MGGMTKRVGNNPTLADDMPQWGPLVKSGMTGRTGRATGLLGWRLSGARPLRAGCPATEDLGLAGVLTPQWSPPVKSGMTALGAADWAMYEAPQWSPPVKSGMTRLV